MRAVDRGLERRLAAHEERLAALRAHHDEIERAVRETAIPEFGQVSAPRLKTDPAFRLPVQELERRRRLIAVTMAGPDLRTPEAISRAINEAGEHYRQGRLDAAEKICTRVLKAAPDWFDALHLAGMLKLEAGKAAAAQVLLVRALKQQPSSTQVLSNLGRTLSALNAYRQSIRLSPATVVNRETVATLHRRLMPFHRHYARSLFAHLPPVIRDIARLYYLGNLRFHFDLHEQCLDAPEAWPMPCTAGETSIVIDHNGRFRACEMRGIVGDLHDYDFDVRRALASEAMSGEVAAIPGANCWCMHSCFIQDSSKFSKKVQLLDIPRATLQRDLAELERRNLAAKRSDGSGWVGVGL